MMEVKALMFNPFHENTYLLFNDKKECIIVDPGCYYEFEIQKAWVTIEEQNARPVRLLNTHCHLDHIFGNSYLCKRYGLQPEIHRMEKAVLDRAPQAGLMYQLPMEVSPEPGRYLEDGEFISFGDDVLQVIWTPGHSPGSVSFYAPKQKFILGGDVLFYESIGRTDLPGGSEMTLLRTIREKFFTLDDDVVVYSGHGKPTTIGHEKRMNPYVHQPD